MATQLDEQIDDDASWAKTFGANATGSQRRQYAGYIDEASKRDAARQEAEFEALQLRDPKVGRLVLDREKQAWNQRQDRLKGDLSERKFQWDVEKNRKADEVNRLRDEIALTREQRLMGQAERDARKALRIEKETDNVQQYIDGMIEKGEMPGTDKFAYGAAETLRQNPFIPDDLRKRIIEDAQILQDPAEAQRRLAAGDVVTETVDPEGKRKFTFTSRPKEEPKDTGKQDAYRERAYARGERNAIESKLKDASREKDPTAYDAMKAKRDEFNARAEAADTVIRGGGKTTTAPVPKADTSNFTDPEGFKSAFSQAAPGTTLMYNGKAYKKP